ncbi:hydrogenase formation protein HypD [Petrachloros mirabilis]
MKYVDDFRRRDHAETLAAAIASTVTRPWTIMEVCGGQTHAIVRFGLDELMPKDVTLVHGPGCPVCVTPVALIDQAIRLASIPRITFCTFGDMLRVPGSQQDLFAVKAAGGDVRIIYSPLDAIKLAETLPEREIVCFAVGFETTAPAFAMAVQLACTRGLQNFSLLVAHVLVPPAIEAILSAPACRIQGFLAAGHVCTIMGYEEYEPLAARFHVPIVVTGFEPVDILEGVLMAVSQLEQRRAFVENQYVRSVREKGNQEARSIIAEVFEPTVRTWRGIGVIPQSGLKLTRTYERFDAALRYQQELTDSRSEEIDDSTCRSGLVLQGLMKPVECEAFGTRCTPEHPLGAPMVSGEGACAAYYRYRAGAKSGALGEGIQA